MVVVYCDYVVGIVMDWVVVSCDVYVEFGGMVIEMDLVECVLWVENMLNIVVEWVVDFDVKGELGSDMLKVYLVKL